MLGLLITIVGLVVGRGMVDYWGVSWRMVNSMVGNNWSSMNCMMNRGSMMDSVSTECCKLSSRTASHKGDKSNQSKDLKRNFFIINYQI